MVLGYPPHCTHALQGLDVVCFARMKEDWKQVINEFETLHRARVTKADFISLFGQAYCHAFTKDTIEAAFQVTGIYPFDRTVITEKQMKSSEAMSTKGSFVVTYTSPVCAIVTSFKAYQPTAFDVSPTNAYVQPPPNGWCPSLPAAATDRITESPHPVTSPSPRTPSSSPKRFRDSMIDPTLISSETPSKWMQMMVSELGATQSGSFLVLRAKFSLVQPFPRLTDH